MLYSKADILTTSKGKQYFKAKKFPSVPPAESDLYVVTVESDRLDVLAYTFYKDPTLWWVIAAVNNNVTLGSMFPIPGTQLRIPTDLNRVLTILNSAN